MRYARGILYVIYFLMYLPVIIPGMMIIFVGTLWRIFHDCQDNRLFRKEYQNKAPDQLLHKINTFYQCPEHKAISS
jgi:uncharacterized membrane protein YesL